MKTLLVLLLAIILGYVHSERPPLATMRPNFEKVWGNINLWDPSKHHNDSYESSEVYSVRVNGVNHYVRNESFAEHLRSHHNLSERDNFDLQASCTSAWKGSYLLGIGNIVYSGQGWDVNGCWLTQQSDGNFVFYDRIGRPMWASGAWTSNPDPLGYYTIMQSDGNLVTYNSNGRPIWASNTWKSGGKWFGASCSGYVASLVIEKSFNTPCSSAMYVKTPNKFWLPNILPGSYCSNFNNYASQTYTVTLSDSTSWRWNLQGRSANWGTPIIIWWDSLTWDNEAWEMVGTKEGYYRFSTGVVGFLNECVDVNGNSENSILRLWNCDNPSRQTFTVFCESCGEPGNRCKIQHINSGLCVNNNWGQLSVVGCDKATYWNIYRTSWGRNLNGISINDVISFANLIVSFLSATVAFI